MMFPLGIKCLVTLCRWWHNVNAILTGNHMATNFKVSGDMKSKKTPTGHYEPVKEHKDEMRRIAALEKELKHHEKMPASKAHG
jgi:hypothetical protein